MPSGILRMEVSLFSGYELSNAPPTIIDPKENIVDMLHGYNGNTLWFIFANISSNCPICVQYMARSIFIISSLRPAYVRIYPAGREDLAAEMFFHTHVGSSLLKGITEDDLITWFGRNATGNDSPFDEPCECQLTCNTDETTTTTTTVKSTINDLTTLSTMSTMELIPNNTPHYIHKIDEFIVSTYTINVDDNSEKLNATLEKSIIIPTSRPLKMNNGTIEVKKPDLDEIILQGDLDNPTEINTSTEPLTEHVPTTKETTITEEETTITTTHTTIPSTDRTTIVRPQNKKNLKKQIKNPNKLLYVNAKNKLKVINKPIAIPVQIELTTETSTTYDYVTRKSVDLKIPSPSSSTKHVNTKTQDIPLTLIEEKDADDKEINNFAPENKNDKYVLLDKEKLWGLLKEVAYDELHKKTKKIVDMQKLLNNSSQT